MAWFVKLAADGHWSRWRIPDFTLIDRSTTTAGDAVLTGAVNVQPAPAVSADGKYFATAHSACPRPSQVACGGSVVVWEAATGSQVGEPVRIAAQAVQNWMHLRFHPDLPLLAIASQNLITVVSLEDGSPTAAGSFAVENLNAPYISNLDFLPSTVAPSATLVVHASQHLSVWDVARNTEAPLGSWNHQATVRGMAVAPDGTLALMRASGDLNFVDHDSLIAGTEPEPLSVVPGVAPPGQGVFMSFGADGRTVALRNSIAGTVSVWDLETKSSIGASFATDGTTSADLLPDGTSLLVATDKQTILWSLDTDLWPEHVCFAAGRNLTEEEWTKYLPGRDYETTCDQWPSKPTS
jgi:WD40 repeat protein